MKILVIGDSGIDVFQYGTVPRICQEAPVGVFMPTHKVVTDGMAANVRRNLEAIDGNLDVVLATNSKKPVKTRFVEEKSNQMIMRMDEFDSVEPCKVENIDFSIFDATIVSDYCKGFLSNADLVYIAHHSKLSFLDTKKKLKASMKAFDYIKINRKEWEDSENVALGIDWEDKLIVTLGEDGCDYNGKNYPVENKVVGGEISGAGDTFLAALVCDYLKSKDIKQSIKFANKMAGIVVSKKGVSVPL